MKRSSASLQVIGIVGLVFAAGLIWLAKPDDVLAQPPVPHPVEGREDCLSCHESGVAGAPQVPDDHAGRTSETCLACHGEGASEAAEETGEAAPPIPHAIEGREDCQACHVHGAIGEASDETTAVSAGELEPVPTPLAYPEPEGDANTCFDCHKTLGGRSERVVDDWQSSIHAERGVICADCHGGDASAEDMAEAMSPEAGYIGKPDRTDIPDLCGSCHADVTLMRQYDLPTDQLAKYNESLHGQLLAEGDTNVATCYDCHDGHATRETNDPSASVYHLNVPQLCATCHADEDYMADYEIPTNQFALYEVSVHGIALLENQDTRAPSCATCHGTHGAAPPGFSEVANVCGSCHSATQDYYLASAHNSSNPESPRCVNCHGRYDVLEPSEEMFLGGSPRHCEACHAPDSDAGQVVTALYEALVEADVAFVEAEDAVKSAASQGMIVREEEGILADARTRLITARAAQHTVDVDVVLAESDASLALSEQARQQAEDAIAEGRFRRQAMVVAVGVIVLIIVSLVLLRRELIARKG